MIVAEVIGGLRRCDFILHLAVKGTVSKTGKVRKTAMDAQTHPGIGDRVGQRIRERIEEVFGWIREPGGFAPAKICGGPKVEAVFTFAVATCNLVRIPKRLQAGAICPPQSLGRRSDRQTIRPDI